MIGYKNILSYPIADIWIKFISDYIVNLVVEFGGGTF